MLAALTLGLRLLHPSQLPEGNSSSKKTKDPVILQKFVRKCRDVGWYDLNNDVMLTHHPNEMGWASTKPAGIVAFGLNDGFDMDWDLEEQPSEHEIWILHEDFYDCVEECQKLHPNDDIDFIHKEDFFKGSAAQDNDNDSSSGSFTTLSPVLKGPPHGRAKPAEDDTDDSEDDNETPHPSPRGKAKTPHFGNDDDSDNEEDFGTHVMVDEMKMASPSETGKARWAWCFCCSKGLYSSLSLIVFDCKVFDSEQCPTQFKANIVHPTPHGADLTGIADHAATPVTKPTAFVFESPTRATTTAKAASAVAAKSKTPPKKKLTAQKKKTAKKPMGIAARPHRAGTASKK